jgi:CBS domain containing-hemolysin-like protein
MSLQATVEVAVLVLCVILAMLASGTETALTSIGRLRVRHLVDEGSPEAAVLQRLQRDPNRFLSTVLVANTVALIVGSSMATLLVVEYLPFRWAEIAQTVVLSLLLLIFAEVTPKSLAIRNAERVALWAARPVDVLATGLRPILWFLTIVARGITGGRAAHGPYVTEQELMTILSVSEEQGVIEEGERDMISNVIEIGDKSVREVMVPRPDIVAVDRAASLAEINAVIRTHGHTRIPVYDHDIDHVVGLIHSKDVLLHYASGEERSFAIDELLRPVRFTPEQKKVDELLHEMQKEKVHMVIVVDEHGGTAGLVTLEDVLEEIVGEIRDEYDVAEEDLLRIVNESEAVVAGRMAMDELNETLDLRIAESDDYDTVGGYVLSVLGEIPERGTQFETGHVQWMVESVNGQRIIEVRLRNEQRWPEEILIEHGLEPPHRDRAGEDAPSTAGA